MARKPIYFWDGPVAESATTFAEVEQHESGIYFVKATAGRTIVRGSVMKNEAGFGGRQWEVHSDGPIGDDQFPTMKAGVRALMARAAETEETRKMAVRLGLVKS